MGEVVIVTSRARSVQVTPQLARAFRSPQLLLRARFDLPDPFAREVQASRRLSCSVRISPSRSRPKRSSTISRSFSSSSPSASRTRGISDCRNNASSIGGNARLDRDLAELRTVVVAIGRRADRSATRRAGQAASARRPPLPTCRASARSRSTSAAVRAARRARRPRGRSARPRPRLLRQRERPRLRGQRVGHRLANPPDRVGDELDVALRIEAPRRFHQAEVAFVNQIEEGHAEAAVSLGVADDEAEVAFDEPPERVLSPSLWMRRPSSRSSSGVSRGSFAMARR